MATEKETVILEFEVDTKDAVVSIDSLTKANKALREERKNLDLQTESGIKRAKEINTALDKNTDTIKNNSSTLEKQRLNVGNYSGALDKLIPGLGATANGFLAAGKAVVTAFVTNPVGFIIAGIVAAIVGLVKIFTSTEEGGDKLAKAMAFVGAAFDVVYDRAAKLGGALVKLFTGDFIGSLTDAKDAFSGVGDEIAREAKEASALAEILDDLEDREISYAASASATELQIKRLIVESKNRNLTEQQKIDLLQKATDLEIESNKKLKVIKQDELAAAIRKIRLTEEGAKIEQKYGETQLEFAQRLIDTTKIQADERKELSKAVIDYNQVEGQSLVIQEKLNNQIDANLVKQQAKIEKLKELEEKEFEKFKNDIERNELAHQSNDELYQNTLDRLAEIEEKEKIVSDNRAINAANDTIQKQIQLDEQVRANKAASDKVIKIQEDEKKKIIALIIQRGQEIVDLTNSISTGIFAARDKHFKLEENQLAVSLANQKTLLNKQYADDLAALDAKYKSGEISKEEYDKNVLLLNQQNQAAIKKAEIDQAVSLNEVKKKEFEANKKNRIASAIADAAKAVLSTFAAAAGGLILKGIAAASAGVFAGIQVAQIKKEEFVPTTFRTGGYTGDGSPDDLAGGVHKREFVMPADVVSKYGKDHFQSYMDGSIVANGSGGGIQSQGSASQAPVSLVYTEFKKFVREIELKESIVSK